MNGISFKLLRQVLCIQTDLKSTDETAPSLVSFMFWAQRGDAGVLIACRQLFCLCSQPEILLETAALVCRRYAMAECTWLMFLLTDTLSRELKAHKSFFFVYLEVVVLSMPHTNLELLCNSHIKHMKLRWDSTTLAAVTLRQHFSLRVINIFQWIYHDLKQILSLYRLLYTLSILIFKTFLTPK